MARDIIWDYIERIQAGNTVMIESKQVLDRLVNHLHVVEWPHSGVVIGGCSPWHVSVARK